MSIKKAYVDIISFLEANEGKKVGSIIEEIKSMCESKKQTSTVYKDENDNVIAIFCYYHKQWELISEVPYGSKANSTSGYNTMCKVGTSLWTKAQRDAKKAKEDLLISVSNGDIEPTDIMKYQADIEVQRQSISATNQPHGFETLEDLMAYLEG